MEKIKGLSLNEVDLLKEKGLVNYKSDVKTKTVGQIICGNFFTLFNILNFALALIVFFVGSYKNLLFLGVVFCNTLISTFQEIRSKIIVDRLSLLNQDMSTVVRGGRAQKISIYDIVLGDILKFKAGDQIPTDCKVISGSILANESLITGEEESVNKDVSSCLYSGSFVVSGKCYAEAIHVGSDNYASKISLEAKYIKRVNSEIMNFINKIIKYISISIIPIGLFLFLNQMNTSSLEDAALSTVAALIGMIPEGLVLLTSTVLAVSIMRLSKYNVLVQELFCIENLARVDTLCLDKTGTITEGKMEVSKIVPLNGIMMNDITDALGLISYHMMDDNQTMHAIGEKYARKNDYNVLNIVYFSSSNKWSGISFEKESFVLGAPDIICDNKIKELNDYADERVVLLSKSKKRLNNKLPDDLEPMALIIIGDKIRKDAKNILNYFKEEGVQLKIISGDNPLSVSSIARRCGFDDVNYIDMSKNEEPIISIVENYNIFGRVKPDQKKEIILALKAHNHVVAMTGDGVNDVLALKEADCSIAMNSGSDAARNVSQIVLLDSDFSSMPKVVSEGRRSINNIQRSSSLFLCKTTYATMLAIIFMFLGKNYPFVPIQLTLTSTVTIGIPSFVLALEPNNERINGKIIVNVLKKSIPTALTIVTNIMLIMVFPSFIRLTTDEVSTLCVIMTGIVGFMLLYRISVPFNRLRRFLFFSLISLFVFEIVVFREFFSLTIISPTMVLLIAALFSFSAFMFNYFTDFFNKLTRKFNL
ncbi:MAG: HAD-IC family P-type ATPase [Bacilli bacterium]|nr:HAD-IC family P-type ATPase [Bacilli bacterium]